MSNSVPTHAPRPLELERIQSSRAGAGEIRLRLSGRWVDPRAAARRDEELLVVNLEGRRHRFGPDPDQQPDHDEAPDRWSATFTVPSWAEPREEGQAALWVGTAVIPVPALRTSLPTPPARPPRSTVADEFSPPPPQAGGPQPPEPSRSGPLADLMLKETVAALQAEVEQRTADAAQVRVALASAQSELDARVDRHGALEMTLGELRDELERLREAVQVQRRELQERTEEAATLREQITKARAASDSQAAEAMALRGELAAANVAREAAVSEAAGLRAELARVGSELAVTRETVQSDAGELGEATRLLEEARALADELRSGDAGD